MNRPHFSSFFKYALVFLALNSVSPAFAVGPLPCDVLLGTISQDLADAYQQIQEISPALVRGEQTPKWADFENLKHIVFAVRNGKQLAAETGKLKELEFALTQVEYSVPDHPALLALRESAKEARKLDIDVYKPGEYALKREYQHLIWELNRELPAALRIPSVRLPYDARAAALVEQGKAIIARHENTFQNFFYDTGFKTIGEVKSALLKYSDTTRNLVQDFENENLEFAMNRPLNARWWVPRVGFQNQRVTGSSRGTLSPDMRNNAEAKLIGEDLATYVATDDQLKPVYGYLKPVPQPGLKQSAQASHYGEDTYIFKKDRVHDRLTWTSGDSLGYGRWGANTPDQKPSNWKGYFVPWKYRYLIIPDILSNIEDQKMGYQSLISGTPPSIFPGLPKPPIQPAWPVPRSLPSPKSAPQPELPPAPVGPEPYVAGKYPARPTAPSVGAKPPQPLMPALKEGQTFEEAQKLYMESKPYKKFLAESQRVDQEYQEAVKIFNETEMKNYQEESAAFRISEQQRQIAYNEREDVKEYNAARQKWQAEVQAIQAQFRESEAFKKYFEEMQAFQLEQVKINAENQEKIREFQQSEVYLEFTKAQAEYQAALQAIQTSEKFKWYQYNFRINPYFIYTGTPLAKMRGPMTQGYVELQYWGPVTLDDVETFEFKTTPPAGEFLIELQKRGIKIRDGRVDPAVEWNP